MSSSKNKFPYYKNHEHIYKFCTNSKKETTFDNLIFSFVILNFEVIKVKIWSNLETNQKLK